MLAGEMDPKWFYGFWLKPYSKRFMVYKAEGAQSCNLNGIQHLWTLECGEF